MNYKKAAKKGSISGAVIFFFIVIQFIFAETNAFGNIGDVLSHFIVIGYFAAFFIAAASCANQHLKLFIVSFIICSVFFAFSIFVLIAYQSITKRSLWYDGGGAMFLMFALASLILGSITALIYSAFRQHFGSKKSDSQ